VHESAGRFVIPGDTPCKDAEERCQLLLLRLRLCDVVGVRIVWVGVKIGGTRFNVDSPLAE